MLYLILLIFLSFIGGLLLKQSLNLKLLSKDKVFSDLTLKFQALLSESTRIHEDNIKLEKEVSDTIALYDITKEICKTLDENKIFSIFSEQIRNYLKINNCQYLNSDVDLSLYKGYTILPLNIHQDIIGYLVANGIDEKDKDAFQILGQQFLIALKRALLYKKVQELSITDSLTQLFSRQHFLNRLKEELRRSKKFKLSFSFLMIDIDKFKDFNDKFGHLVGDAILRVVSKTIKDTLRQIDFVGRYGGEELTVVLAETNKEQALFVAERLRRAIESKGIKVYDEELKVTVSVGLATFPQDAENTEMIIDAADKALYKAKQAGRNKVYAYKAS